MMRRRRTRRLINVSPIYSLFYFFLSCSSPLLWAAKDTITLNQMITYDNETNLISAGGEFELGFFSPDRASSSSNNRYLGIWYHRLLQESPLTVVWIANRDKPLKTKTGYLILDKDGSLKLLDRPGGEVFWSTVTSSHPTTDITAKLMDSGNLILTEGGENENHAIIWQSFSNESDTFLPGMKMAGTKKLRSWANENDPAPGALTLEVTQAGNRFSFVIKNGSAAYWRSGSSSDFSKSDQIPEYVTYLLSNFSASSTKEIQQNTSLVNKTLNFTNPSPSYVLDNTRLVMHPSGQIRFYNLSQNLTWDLRWWEPKDECSVHHACGPYGVCNSTNKPLCGCLEGFQPMAPEEWNSGQFSEGCLRKIRGCKKEDRFLDLKVIKVGNPDSTIEGKTEEECKAECLDKCPCKAYSVETNMRRGGIPSTCLIWNEQDLMDIQRSVSDQSRVIHVRVAAFPNLGPFCDSNKDCNDHSTCQTSTSENGKRRCICNANYQWNPSTKNCTTRTEAPLPKTGTAELHNTKKLSLSSIVKIIFAAGIVLSCIIISICCLRRRTRIAKKKASRENFQESSIFHVYGSDKHAKEIELNNFGEEEDKVIDVPFFNFERVLAATEDFSNSNKLGEGGFGPVYKGKLPGGKEIAVKRLSRCSGQGLDEFKTEVLLIAKLQHRNLVRLLGYSVKGEEKMLLYQYMPNKSLDSFVFDRTRCLLLNWEKRFNIIVGIARGLLYLHQDSRLRIIHRDLKTSNILLDEEMNPKISDFGLARIVGGNETEANTTRVVGTYGYMSPEYALDGLFSVKSDVFSFGVVLLEILSGKKNTGFYQSEHSVNLLGYAWTLWREDKVLNLVDKSLRETCNACEVSKCINIGLLCVQEDADDRPTMSNVVFMLGSETPTLPTPQQPAFFGKRCPSSIFSSSRGPEMYSANEITVTVEQGR